MLVATSSALAISQYGSNCLACHGPTLATTPNTGQTLNFGKTLVGQSSSQVLTVNSVPGTDPDAIALRAPSLAGSFPASQGAFSLSGTAAFTGLAQGTSTNRTYSYTPLMRGPNTQTMTTTSTPDSRGNSPGSSTVTFSGQGVAPVLSVSSPTLGNVRIGTSATAQIGVQNTGDGNTTPLGTAVGNLIGSAGAGSGAFTGLGGSFSLADGASLNFGYNFSASARGQQTANVVLNMTNGKSDGTNLPHQLSVGLSATGVGPQFESSLGSPGSTIDFTGAATQPFSVTNSTPDDNLGSLTDLTLLSATLGGPDAAAFSISGFTPGEALSALGSKNLGLAFAPTGGKTSWDATLTLLTDQGAAIGASGASFVYNLTASAPVPEPSSLALLAAGALALLGYVLHRRR